MSSAQVRCGAFVISRKLLLFVCLLAGALAYVAQKGWHAYPYLMQQYRAETCSNLGAMDAPQTLGIAPAKVRIIGWVADRAGVERVELVSGNVLLSSVFPDAPRSDVRETFPACPADAAKGFDVTMELDKLGPGIKDLSLYAVKPGGSRYKVGAVPEDLYSMIVNIEAQKPVVWDGDNYIAGWAFSRKEPVEVVVLAGTKVIARAKADGLREDVGKIFPLWPTALRSGFGIALHMTDLPLGRYRLSVQIVDGDGLKKLIQGPEVMNDVPIIGRIEAQQPVVWDGENYISGWAFSRNGPVEVSLLAGTKVLARARADGLREDVGKIFPFWPTAVRSGFGIALRMTDLPRGRYRLSLQIVDGAGQKKLMPGPEVMNDVPIGKVIGQADRFVDPVNVHLEAWLADEHGIGSAQVETESGLVIGLMHPLANGVPLSALPDPRFSVLQKDVAAIKTGNLYAIDIPRKSIPAGLNRLVVRVRDNAGKEAVIDSGPLVLQARGNAPSCQGEKLRVFYPGGAVNFRDGFRQMTGLRKAVEGGCVEVGIRGRTEYLRTTFGKGQDFRFDPDFPEALRKRSKAKEMTGESIRELLNTALRFKAPLLVTLDGGVWADAKFSAPDVDVVDNLEEDPRNVQWNQFGLAEPDDALEHLPGATASPQLARMMSLNRYNKKFLAYKKRNLQAAVAEVVQFMHKHPQIYVAINLDPDEYINPWFYLTQWYDYNPDTLRQYREWLFHLGPYADGGELAFSRHEPKLSLAQVNQLAKQSWQTLEEVDPPRSAPDYSDPWQQLWTQFKRHLVARHYDDLAAWAAQAGMPEDRIFTSQTFIQTDVARSISDPATGWTDQAGVSIEGAKPRHGRLGAILYGPASRNEGKVRSGTSLIGNIRRVDPEWGVVEFHPASIAFPDKLPTHAESYATLLNLINGGARFLSPMWGSYAGDRAVHPGHFKAYDAMEGTSYEYQLVWWLREMRYLPLGSRFYPFGNERVKSADGWSAGAGTTLVPEAGRILLSGNGTHVSLVSPEWDETPRASPMLLEVKGRWPQASVIGASLLFDNGRREEIAATSSGSGRAVFRMAKRPQPLQKLELEWNGPDSVRRQEVEIDSIALRIEPE